MSTYLRPLGMASALLLVLVGFQNCSEKLSGGPATTTLASGSGAPLAPNQKQVILSSGTSWIVPGDATSLDSVETWGGGGGSRTDSNGASFGAAGGGAYAKINNFAVNPGATISYNIGAGGISSNTGNGGSGGDTWFGTPATVLAKGGLGGTNALGGSNGGSAITSIGTVKFAGGDGGDADGLGGAGGGGAASMERIH